MTNRHINEMQLTQYRNPVDILIEANEAVSTKFDAIGLRGLAVEVPATWTAADIGFYGLFGPSVSLLADAIGELLVISGIQTAEKRIYIAPAELWVLGGMSQGRLVSLNTDGSGNTVNQAADRNLRVYRLY